MRDVPLFSSENVSELTRFYREMVPVPGRISASLRFTLSTALATLLLLILQPPAGFIAPSLFMLLLVSHDTPNLCFKGLFTCISAGAIGTAAALLLVIVTGNDPVARVVGLAVFTFLAVFFFRTSVIPLGAMAFGCLTYMVLSLWENHLRPERILHLSLWPMGTLGVVALSATVVEYVFNRSDPVLALRREINARCVALAHLLELCAAGAGAEQIGKQSAIVRRHAVTGEGERQVLLERISAAHAASSPELSYLRAVVLSIDRLLVLGLAFAARNGVEEVDRTQIHAVRAAITATGEGRPEDVRKLLGESRASGSSDLDRIEQTLRRLAEPTQLPLSPPQPEPSPSAASLRDWFKRLLIPDALTNEAHVMYALKVSLCATIAYVIYNGLAWPGISTAFFTVYFTALSTTGSSNRKLVFRVIGSTIGGLILGIGCLVFVFPNIEGVSGFLLVIAVIAFIGVWIAGGPYFGYIGFQIMFAFNLLAFERFRAPDQMTPARDRLLGITLGFLVMFIIFHQVRPERTVDTMRGLLARLLRAQAEFIRVSEQDVSDVRDKKIAALRKQGTALVVNLQNFAHAVKFEFPPDRAPDMRLSSEILNAVTSAGELLISVRAFPPEPEDGREAERLTQIKNAIENGLRDLASSLEQTPDAQRGGPKIKAAPEEFCAVAPNWAARAFDSFRELHMTCDGIVRSMA